MKRLSFIACYRFDLYFTILSKLYIGKDRSKALLWMNRKLN